MAFDISNMTEEEKKELFGQDFKEKSKLDQVQTISKKWKEMPEEKELKAKCITKFKKNMDVYRREKREYNDKVDDFQKSGKSNTIYIIK